MTRQNTRYIVGLTGGIGSGKSTVATLFQRKGIDIVDADIVAREVVNKGSEGLSALVEQFTGTILLPSGELDRSALREIVFNDSKKKDTLNAILHPLIRKSMVNQLANTQSDYCMLVVPLLFENNMQSMADTTVVVDIEPSVQLTRTLARDGGNEATIKGIIAAQISRDKRLLLADDIIHNDADVEHLENQVNVLHDKYLTNAKAKLKH